MEESLVIIKPDAFEKGVCLDILERLILKFDLIRIRVVRLTEEQVREHYSHIRNISIFEDLVRFMISRNVYVMIFRGEGIISRIRAEVGTTFHAAPGTIRGDYGAESFRTLVHASDSETSACEEIKRFFGEFNLLTRNWECSMCGRVGEVVHCFAKEPMICTECGYKICPKCGGLLLSDRCSRTCGIVDYEDECTGSCIRCGWKSCGGE